MNYRTLSIAVILAPVGLLGQAKAGILGSAQSFGVLGGSTVTNTGPTVVTGNVGVWPGLTVTGFLPGVIVQGEKHLGDTVAQQAQSDLTTAYNTLAGMTVTQTLTGTDLGGLTLTPGVYFFANSAMLTNTLTLDALGDPNALFVFQIGSSLTTMTGASVSGVNGANGCHIYWQVGTSATIGVDTKFQGNIVALTSITLNTRATIESGRALARNGAVTLDSNVITAGCIPAPGATVVLGSVALGLLVSRRRRA